MRQARTAPFGISRIRAGGCSQAAAFTAPATGSTSAFAHLRGVTAHSANWPRGWRDPNWHKPATHAAQGSTPEPDSIRRARAIQFGGRQVVTTETIGSNYVAHGQLRGAATAGAQTLQGGNPGDLDDNAHICSPSDARVRLHDHRARSGSPVDGPGERASDDQAAGWTGLLRLGARAVACAAMVS